MDTNRLTKQALQYKPKGRRDIGRPTKRLRDQLHLEDQGTGKHASPFMMMMMMMMMTTINTNFNFKKCARICLKRGRVQSKMHIRNTFENDITNLTRGKHVSI